MGGVGAVICEFDPLHTGHKKVIDLAKSSSDLVLAVLSGNFTQRSLPAEFDKYTRARAAVRCGADLVVELPFPWSCSGAEYYAYGAVSIALSLGTDSFIFGSECGEINVLKKAADYSMSSDYFKMIEQYSNDPGTGAAKIYDDVLKQAGFELGKNDKLATEYIKAVLRANRFDVSFITAKRDSGSVSASEIRKMIAASGLTSVKDYIEPNAYEVYSSDSTVSSSTEKLDLFEFLYFRFFGNEDFDNVFEASGGVGKRLKKAAAASSAPTDFFANASTKKYTDSRLRRAALYSMIGVIKNDLSESPSFTHLLAANENGRKYLSRLDDLNIRVITKPSDFRSAPRSKQITLENKADELYSLCCVPPAPYGRFVRSSPYIE